MATVLIETKQSREVVDITDEIACHLPERGSGIVNAFIQHTTAAITTADLDPGTDLDLLDALHGMLPGKQWRHPHNPEHAPAHLLSSIVGPEASVPFADGKLQLGAWQRIILIEFDGPRERKISVSLITLNSRLN